MPACQVTLREEETPDQRCGRPYQVGQACDDPGRAGLLEKHGGIL